MPAALSRPAAADPAPTGRAPTDRALLDQRAFRALMAAMAEPGLPRPLDPAPGGLSPAPAPLGPEMAAVARALLDYETPFWLDAALAGAPDVADHVRFETGARLVEAPGKAAFALLADAARLPDFSLFAQGEPDYPDRSATLIIRVAGFREGPLVLEGPGIDGRRRFGAEGLPQDFAARLQENRAGFPLGVDLILVAPGAVAALPRTVAPVKGG